MQVDAMRPTRDLENVKDKHADQPAKKLRHPFASSCCLRRTAMDRNDSFSKIFVHICKMFFFFDVRRWQRCFLLLCIYNIYSLHITGLYTHVNVMYIHARILETATNTVFMAWLPACPPLLHILNQINPFHNPRLHFDCNTVYSK